MSWVYKSYKQNRKRFFYNSTTLLKLCNSQRKWFALVSSGCFYGLTKMYTARHFNFDITWRHLEFATAKASGFSPKNIPTDAIQISEEM